MSLAKSGGYWIQDCAAATQNILLEIADQGFGAVWLGVYPREERVEGARALLNLPSHIVPFSLIALGYPAEEKAAKNIFDRDRIKFNGWT
jgi:nitroreductase